MAGILPLLQEILPMLMPGSVHVTKAEELRRPPGLQHLSEDEADPSDQDDDDDDDDSDKDGDGDDDNEYPDAADLLDGEVSPTTAWRTAAFPGHVPRRLSERERTARSVSEQRARQAKKERQRLREERRRLREEQRANKARAPAHGVTLRDAVVHKSGSLCASILTVKPGCETVVFHNGEQEAIVYAVSGTAELATLPDDFDEYNDDDRRDDDDTGDAASLRSVRSRPEPAKHTIGAGDFAFIPAWTEHQVRNIGEPAAASAATETPAKTEPTTTKTETKTKKTTTVPDVVWVVVRNASEPTVVPLKGWGGEAT